MQLYEKFSVFCATHELIKYNIITVRRIPNVVMGLGDELTYVQNAT